MRKQYFEAIHPARDGRDGLSNDERIARYAGLLISSSYDGDELAHYSQRQGIETPKPNRSARIVKRSRAGMGEWITVEASAEFFAQVEAWIEKLDAASFPAS